MKILFLDDDKLRHAKFIRAHIGKDVTYVWTAEEAIKALKNNVFDEVSLDHDLGGVSSQLTEPAAGEGSGYDVALFIAKMSPEKRPKLVILHSFNPAGVLRMGQAIRNCEPQVRVYKVPFCW